MRYNKIIDLPDFGQYLDSQGKVAGIKAKVCVKHSQFRREATEPLEANEIPFTHDTLTRQTYTLHSIRRIGKLWALPHR